MSIAFVPSTSEIDDFLEQVEQAIHTKTLGRVQELRVRIDSGYLVVTGRTSTYYNKQLVTHAARDAMTQLPVQNDVEVG